MIRAKEGIRRHEGFKTHEGLLISWRHLISQNVCGSDYLDRHVLYCLYLCIFTG